MWPHGIVVPVPHFDDHLRLATTAEPLQAQAFVAESVVEALVGAVLPWLPGIDQRNLSTILRHSPKCNYCRSPLPFADFGGLIQTAVGGSAGRGARLTNRSGCAA